MKKCPQMLQPFGKPFCIRLMAISLMALSYTLYANCQTDTLHVKFVAYWNIGDTFNFNVTKVKQVWDKAKLTQNDSLQYTARFEVMGADTGSYTIRWSANDMLVNLFKIPGAARNRFNQYEITEVIYSTDETGVFKGIVNWQQISNMITGFIHQLIGVMGEDNAVNKDDMQKAMNPLINLYSTKRGIEQFVFKELQMIHFPFGQQYDRYEIYNYVEKLPNPLGGEPINGDGILLFRYADFVKQRCMMVQRMKILPDTAKNVLIEYFKAEGIKPGAFAKELNFSKLEISDNNYLEYDYNPGIPVKIDMTREMVLEVYNANIRRIDRTIITRVD